MTKTKTKTEKSIPVGDRMLAQIQREDATYFGPCVVQASGAWTRCGPTWHVPNIGWICYGPGVNRWGTQRGLAQLASDADAAPQWHAEGWSIAPVPNVVFAMLPAALNSKPMERVAELGQLAEALVT